MTYLEKCMQMTIKLIFDHIIGISVVKTHDVDRNELKCVA